jgi:hypothetical protein
VGSRLSRGEGETCGSDRTSLTGLLLLGLVCTAPFASTAKSERKGELASSSQRTLSSSMTLPGAILFEVIGVEKKAGDIGEAGFFELRVEGVRGASVMILVFCCWHSDCGLG